MAIVVTLKQGTTTIASRTISSLTTSFTNYSFALTGGELALITDASNLTLEFQSGAAGEAIAYTGATIAGSTVYAQPRITEAADYRITEDQLSYRITEGAGEPTIIDTTTAMRASFFAVF